MNAWICIHQYTTHWYIITEQSMRRSRNIRAADFNFKLSADHLMDQTPKGVDVAIILHTIHSDQNDNLGKMAAVIKLS